MTHSPVPRWDRSHVRCQYALAADERLSRYIDLPGAEMRSGKIMWLLELVDLENRVTLLRNA